MFEHKGSAGNDRNFGEIKMTELSVKDYILNELSFEVQSVALDFVSFLEEKGVTFYKDNCDCWKDKIYYQ